jgi:hypothetical protein
MQEEDTKPQKHTHTHTHTHTKDEKLKRFWKLGIDKYLQQVCNRNNNNHEASTKKDNLTMATILKNPHPQQNHFK